MKFYYKLNQQGVTLVEVLAAIVLLGIILVSVVSFFPQMARTNTFNEEKMQAVNSAKEKLNEWQNNQGLQLFLADPIQNEHSLPTNCDPTTYTCTDTVKLGKKTYIVRITIAEADDLAKAGVPNHAYKAHQILVQIIKDSNEDNVLTETYGYIYTND